MVSWEPLTKGLAIGQSGTIGVDPVFESLSATGVWHNGSILTRSDTSDSFPLSGGDGFQTSIDAAGLTGYFNCNAGFGGAICRYQLGPFIFITDTIWNDNTATKHWRDPHRPGHLLRLQKVGLLFRTTVANSASPDVLNTNDAWEAVDPFFGKTGKTTTMAFRSRVLEEQPVYYIGTDTGQIWRGSPEVGWTKLCECGSQINAIAPDLRKNERVFVVLKGSISPGRIKELSRKPDGSWENQNIDSDFAPELAVKEVFSVVVDPAIPDTHGTTVYVGTDQGVYRGHIDSIILDPTISARRVIPPVFGEWTWRRSPGVPNVSVPDIEVHQNFQGQDHSGIIRAGTYGRGIFELKRVSSTGLAVKLPATLSVQAIQSGEDGAPSPLTVTIPVVAKDKKYDWETPFELSPVQGTEVSLEAPIEIRKDGGVLKFAGWVISGKPEAQPKITLKVEEATKAIAYYEQEKLIPDSRAKPVNVSVSASAKQLCVQSFTHELTISWEVKDGQRPVIVRAEITYPR